MLKQKEKTRELRLRADSFPRILPRTTSYSHQADDGDDFDGREPELHLSVDLNTQKVDHHDGDEKRGDPSGLVDRRVPVFSSKDAKEIASG